MKHTALAAAIMVLTTQAYALTGTVLDQQGSPISGAKVQSITPKMRVLTNSNGVFEIADDANEIHITAPGYSHQLVHLHNNTSDTLSITLAPTVIEQVDVIGLPIHASIIESSMPVAVLTGKSLRNQQAATLGDTLERQPGVTSNFHGNVASTPIIRGLSGPRVLITQNSLDVSDVSRVGPDHAVASEISTAQQVEILRGPATLFYGSGAIGGVVNVVDHRVPTDPETRGEIMAAHDTVNNQNLTAFNVTTGINNWAFYADGFWREADDYQVPVNPEQASHEHNDDHGDDHGDDHSDADKDDKEGKHDDDKQTGDFFVENSAEQSSGLTLGSSYLLDNGFVGVAVERLDREYGIPGRSHGGHEHEEGEEEGEEAVFADLNQTRVQLQSELTVESLGLRQINTRAAYTDYEHTEFENGQAGTTFANKTTELRVDLLHQEWAHWKGGFNIHYKRSDIVAEGEEAFTPPSVAKTFALALMEEKHIGNVLLQMGARAERVTISADNVLLPPLDLHSHSEEGDKEDGKSHEEGEEHGHDEEHGHGEELTRVFEVDHEFTPVSVSFGAVWDYQPGYNVGISLSHAQRAPSASELLSFGPHIGTRTYEIGALFALQEGSKEGENGEKEETYFGLSDDEIRLETSNNIDLTFRKHEGDLGIIINAYFNKIDDYYYQNATGFFAESGHDHGEEGEDEHDHDEEIESEEGHGEEGHSDEHEDELPVFLFSHEDAEFYGLEAQGIWKINNNWETTLFTDFVHGELTDGRNVPRTPPMRVGAHVDFTYNNVTANFSWMHYAKQDNVADLETPTEGYDMLDLSIDYQLPLKTVDLTFFLRAKNLTDTEARVHTSFIKDVAPRPGRNFSLGIRGTF